MLNYSLNKEDSKTFIKYYKEKDDSIIVHYADKTKLVVENTEEMKNKLNRIEEEQIESFNDSSYSSKKDVLEGIGACFGLAFFGSLAISCCGGVIGLFVGGFSGAFAVVKFSTLLYIPATLISGAVAGYALSGRKFNLFLEYKDRINEYLKAKNNDEEVVDTNTNNLVVKPKKVKNLCINDVNFMSYRQIKKITKAIDKEEAKQDKYEALGIDKDKVLVKRYK